MYLLLIVCLCLLSPGLQEKENDLWGPGNVAI